MRRFYRFTSLLPASDFWPLIFCLWLLTSDFCSVQDLIIHHIDVGQGDCTLIQTCCKTILVDAGNSGKGECVVIPYLKSLKVSRINHVIASHYHADHIGGLDEVLDVFGVDTVFDRGSLHTVPRSNIYASYVKAIVRTPRVTAQPGTKYGIGRGLVLRFVAADGKCEGDHPAGIDPATERSIDENSLSIGFTITFVDTVIQSTTNPELRTRYTYFTGGDLTGYDDRDAIDLETSVASIVGHADAMKVNHHGSRTSTNPMFISTLSPACVFISLGRNNSYGHPAPVVIARLQQHPTIQWIYQTEGKATVSPKQKIVGTSVLNFYAKGDSSYFTVEWKADGRSRHFYRCGNSKLTAAP